MLTPSQQRNATVTKRERILGKGLGGRLIRVFIMQALAISVVTVIGVYATGRVVEDVLIKQALDGEAEHFWKRYAANSESPEPDTNNLKGYLARGGDLSAIPDPYRGIESGYRRVDAQDGRRPLVHVSNFEQARLYLVFDEVHVSRLTLLFGIAPLSIVLLLIYALSWIGYRMSLGAVSPLLRLAHRVNAFDVRNDSLADLDLSDVGERGSAEVGMLVSALNHFTGRLGAFLERERNFTRNASHELRTPLAIMASNADLLARQVADRPSDQVVISRIKRALKDMQSLLDTLLMLAREDESKLPREPIILNDLLQAQLEACHRQFSRQDVRPQLAADCLLQLHAPEKVLTIVFNNLLRNAFEYTDSGTVGVNIDRRGVEVWDTGRGMDAEATQRIYEPFYRVDGSQNPAGHGLGMSIVQRLCRRFGWSIDINSELNRGTRVRIAFPDVEVLATRRSGGPA